MHSINISISASQSKSANNHTTFKHLNVISLAHLSAAVTQYVWSPATYRGGRRHGNNFEQCELAVLDFDQGRPTLADMRIRLERLNVIHILSTTKSHQKQKQSGQHLLPAVDRYRVILPLAGPFNREPERFKWQMRQIHRGEFKGCDRACKDAARFYWPSVEIVSCIDTGNYFEIIDAPTVETIAAGFEKSKCRLESMRDIGIMPRWLRLFLAHGIGVGERRPMIFKSAATMARLGYKDLDIQSILCNVPIDRTGITTADFERQVGRGIEKGKDTKS